MNIFRYKVAMKYFLFWLFLLLSLQIKANDIVELSLEDKARESDLVVIGTVQEIFPPTVTQEYSLAEINIKSELKGHVKGKLSFYFNGPISEENPDCCDVNGVYVFFLKKSDLGFYYSVNGPFGIYKIQGLGGK
jgi:hypothetical protein